MIQVTKGAIDIIQAIEEVVDIIQIWVPKGAIDIIQTIEEVVDVIWVIKEAIDITQATVGATDIIQVMEGDKKAQEIIQIVLYLYILLQAVLQLSQIEYCGGEIFMPDT